MKFDLNNGSLEAQIVEGILSVTGPAPVALHEPSFIGNEWRYLKECLDSTFVSSVGAFVDRFEADLSHFTGATYAVAVVNGTAALHIALKLSNVQPNDEVLLPALTFIATANAVSYCGATPHLIDSAEDTLGVDPHRLRTYLLRTTELRSGQCINRATGRVIRALLPVHTFGHPVDMEGVMAVAHDFGLALVEDASESLGSFIGGRHSGTFGKLGTLSFNGNKTITTGGGGAILTNDSTMAKRAKHITTTAKVPHRWAYMHSEVGYNYRMPNLNAALGCAQLEQLPAFIKAKRQLYERYKEAFSRIPRVKLVGEPPGCSSNYWLQTLLLEEAVEQKLDAILSATNNAGLSTRPAWCLMNKLPFYQACPKMDLYIAESLARRVINIPSSSSLV